MAHMISTHNTWVGPNFFQKDLIKENANFWLTVACWVIFHTLLIMSKFTFSKNYFRNTIRVSNSLDPDQNVGPDLGPNCLQRLLVNDKSCSLA